MERGQGRGNHRAVHTERHNPTPRSLLPLDRRRPSPLQARRSGATDTQQDSGVVTGNLGHKEGTERLGIQPVSQQALTDHDADPVNRHTGSGPGTHWDHGRRAYYGRPKWRRPEGPVRHGLHGAGGDGSRDELDSQRRRLGNRADQLDDVGREHPRHQQGRRGQLPRLGGFRRSRGHTALGRAGG